MTWCHVMWCHVILYSSLLNRVLFLMLYFNIWQLIKYHFSCDFGISFKFGMLSEVTLLDESPPNVVADLSNLKKTLILFLAVTLSKWWLIVQAIYKNRTKTGRVWLTVCINHAVLLMLPWPCFVNKSIYSLYAISTWTWRMVTMVLWL